MSDAPVLEAVRALRFLSATGARDPLLVLGVPGWPGDSFAERLLGEGWTAGVGVLAVEDLEAPERISEAAATRASVAIHLAGLEGITGAAASADEARRQGDRFVAWLDRLAAAGCPIVWSVRETDTGRARFPEAADRVRRHVAARAHIVHVPSAAAAGSALAGLDVPADRVVVVPHPGFGDRCTRGVSRAADRFAIGLAPDETVFVAAGSPFRPADAALLLEAWRAAGRPADARRLVVATAEAIDDRLSAMLDVAPGVMAITGALAPDRLAPLLRSADVLVLHERDPLASDALLLALEHGLPIVAPTIRAELEMLDDQVACRFEAGDATGLADALRRAPRLAGPAAAAAAREMAAQHEPGAVSSMFVAELRRRLARA